MGIKYSELFTLITFIPLFIATVLAIKLIGKTSLKDFVLGVGGKVNKKQCLLIAGLYLVGFALPLLITMNNLHLRGAKWEHFVFTVLLALVLAWIQTTWEELVFRGVVFRWLCKNKIDYSKRAWIAAAVSTVAFMAAHLTNPEVTSQSGIDIVIAATTYLIFGVVYAWADIHFGSLLPGMIIHMINNFLLFTLVISSVSVVSFPTLLVDTTPDTASWEFFSTMLCHLPLIVYMAIDLIRHKKKAAGKQ